MEKGSKGTVVRRLIQMCNTVNKKGSFHLLDHVINFNSGDPVEEKW